MENNNGTAFDMALKIVSEEKTLNENTASQIDFGSIKGKVPDELKNHSDKPESRIHVEPKEINHDIINKTFIQPVEKDNIKIKSFKHPQTNIVPVSHNNKRMSKNEYYLTIAESIALRGTCLRRRFGAIIVKDDRIVSTGYVGAPRGRINCCDIGTCFRESNNIPSGQRYELCRSVHAEMNAIINASSEEMKGAIMYLCGLENDGSYTHSECCAMCKRAIINAGISFVIKRQPEGYIVTDVNNWIENDDSLDINHKGY